MPGALAGLFNFLGGPVGVIGALGLNAIGIPVSGGVIGKLLGIGPKRPKPSDGQQTIREAIGWRQRHYGIVNTGGQLSFLGSRDGTLGIVVTLGTGREGDILEHKINDKVVTVVGGNVTDASFEGALHIYTRSGDPSQTAIGELTAKFSEWTSNHRQRGCAHAAIIGDPVKQKKFAQVYNSQMPTYTQTRKGAFCYDPRLDSTAIIFDDGDGFTVNGTGPVRLNNEATWPWTENAALVIADYFAHPDGYGGGYDAVNWTRIAGEADISDELVTTLTGATIARWRIWASYSLAAERRQVMADMLKACDGFIWQDANCQFNLMVGRFVEPTVVITDDHICGLGGDIGPEADQRSDAVKVLYTEATIGYREQESATMVRAGALSDPTSDAQPIEAYYIPHHNQAARVGKLELARLGDRWHLNLSLNLFGLNLLGERFCRVRSAQLGVDAPFSIAGLKLVTAETGSANNMRIQAQLEEVAAADWLFNAELEEGVPPVAPGEDEEEPVVPMPTALALDAVQIALGETNGVAIAASWAISRDGLAFEAQYRPTAGGDWVGMTTDEDTLTARSGPVDSGTEYEVRVRSVTLSYRVSDWTAVVTITPSATAFLGAPTELAAVGGVGSADISFRMPTQPSLAYARLYSSATNVFGTATQVGTDIVAGLGAVVTRNHAGLSPGTRYYWARAFKSGGASSALAGSVAATIS